MRVCRYTSEGIKEAYFPEDDVLFIHIELQNKELAIPANSRASAAGGGFVD